MRFLFPIILLAGTAFAGSECVASEVTLTSSQVIITWPQTPPVVAVVPVQPAPVQLMPVLPPAVTFNTVVPVTTYGRVGLFGWRRGWRTRWALGPPATYVLTR